MNRILVRLILMLAVASGLPSMASAVVSMTGEWFNLAGPTVKLPVLGPNSPCAPAGVAPCIFIDTNLAVSPFPGVPAGGGVPGADADMDADKITGGSFLIDPDVFFLANTARNTVVPQNKNVRQLVTTITYRGPAATVNQFLDDRFELATPPPGTRLFNATNYLDPGNAQAARAAANTVPLTFGTIFTTVGAGAVTTTTMTTGGGTNTNVPGGATVPLPIRIEYIAGQNTFGGVMSVLLDGGGKLYIAGTAFGNPTRLGITLLEDPANTPITDPPRARPNGAGWGLINTGGQPGGDLHTNATPTLNANPCATNLPPLPVGCESILDTGTLFYPGALAPANSTLIGFAWTTGTVLNKITGVDAGGNPTSYTLTAHGKDTVTSGGDRNISLVSAGLGRRTSSTGVRHTGYFGALTLTLVPEPGTTLALVGGIALLGFLARRGRN